MAVAQDSMQDKTGHGWDEWCVLLDEWGATERSYADIAGWLTTEHGLDNWWAQKIAVTYMQVRGVRAPGEHGDGSFNANASKTIDVAVDRVYEAFTSKPLRERWLPGATIRIRTSTPPKSLRADWAHGPSRIAVGFVAKGPAKAEVGVMHEKLATADDAADMKTYWRTRLTDLKHLLEG